MSSLQRSQAAALYEVDVVAAAGGSCGDCGAAVLVPLPPTTLVHGAELHADASLGIKGRTTHLTKSLVGGDIVQQDWWWLEALRQERENS